MLALAKVLLIAIDLYTWVVIAAAIMSWLTAFGVVNRYNRVVATIEDMLFRLTDPALRPIRRIIPNLGGVDISPVILLLFLYFLKFVIEDEIMPYLYPIL
jgi:YggT family protein